MERVALISCCKKKINKRCKVKDLYISDSFLSDMALAEKLKLSDKYVISAKHGLLEMDEEIEPYDVALTYFNVERIEMWASSVIKSLACKKDLKSTKFYIFADENYYLPLIEHLPHHEVISRI